VAIVEHGNAMDGFHPRDFGCKRRVIGRVEIPQPIGNVGFGRLGAVLPDGLAVEIRLGDQACGVLAGIEACPLRIAVGVDHVSVECRANRRRIRQKAVVELVDMPVGIGEQPTVVVQPVPDRRRHVGSRMRKTENDGGGTLSDFEHRHSGLQNRQDIR